MGSNPTFGSKTMTRQTQRTSRLARNIERRTRKNLIFSILGIIIVLFLVVKLGIPLLVNFSLLIANQKDKSATSQNTASNPSFIAPPILNPLPSATNSASLVISGMGNAGQTVRIYINNNLIDETPTEKDGSFSINETLQNGTNTIQAKSELNGKESSFSDPLNVTFSNTKPNLDITSPSDGQTFSKDQNTAQVSGKTDPDIKITVNGFWAIVDDNNNFSYSLPLQNGDNQIKVIATDNAGNTTEKDIKVTYNP